MADIGNHDFVPDFEDVDYGQHQYQLEQSTNGSIQGFQDQQFMNEGGASK